MQYLSVSESNVRTPISTTPVMHASLCDIILCVWIHTIPEDTCMQYQSYRLLYMQYLVKAARHGAGGIKGKDNLHISSGRG